MSKKNQIFFLLTLICILGFFLRFYLLSVIPSSLSADEVAFGYNAYSILKTGKDEFGKSFPLLFQSFNDHKNPVFVYLLVPFIKVFGLNELAIRLPSAILGLAIIPLFFLLTKKLTENNQVSLLSAFLATISPWLIQYSRIALEVNTAFFLSLLGVWLFLKAKDKKPLYILSAFTFGLAFWTYYASKLWVVLFGGFLIVYQILLSPRHPEFEPVKDEKSSLELRKSYKFLLSGIFLFLLMALPYLNLYFSGNILSRQYGISVFSNQEEKIKQAVFYLEDLEKGNKLAKIIHNRRLVPLNQLIGGYLHVISPQILFGQEQTQISQTRLLYLWQVPLILIGLIILAAKKKIFYLILAWLCLGFIPGAITILPPFDRRILINSYPLIFLTSLGLAKVLKNTNKQKKLLKTAILTIMFLILAFSLSNYLHYYFIHGKTAVVNLWGNGMKDLVKKVDKEEASFDKIIVSTRLDQPWIYFLFYQKYPPAKYLSQGGTISGSIFSNENHYGKYYFKDIKETDLSENILYVAPASQSLPCFKIKKTVYLTNGEPLANIGIFEPTSQ